MKRGETPCWVIPAYDSAEFPVWLGLTNQNHQTTNHADLSGWCKCGRWRTDRAAKCWGKHPTVTLLTLSFGGPLHVDQSTLIWDNTELPLACDKNLSHFDTACSMPHCCQQIPFSPTIGNTQCIPGKKHILPQAIGQFPRQRKCQTLTLCGCQLLSHGKSVLDVSCLVLGLCCFALEQVFKWCVSILLLRKSH